MKEREEKEVERVNKKEEEMNEVEPPQFSIRSGRGFRPSTKREQIRMKLQQSKKKVCSHSRLNYKDTFHFRRQPESRQGN